MIPADDFETPTPLFHVGHNDRSLMPELRRQTMLFRDMRMLAPEVLLYANANAGKRNPTKARQEGIVSGVFDVTCCYRSVMGNPMSAYIELKGYQPSGKRWGKLSDAQIRWGNRMHAMGHLCGCFYDSVEAMLWLRDQGAPVRIK
jgi:hypothetical protein